MAAVVKNFTASLTKTAVMESYLTGIGMYAVVQKYTTGASTTVVMAWPMRYLHRAAVKE